MKSANDLWLRSCATFIALLTLVLGVNSALAWEPMRTTDGSQQLGWSPDVAFQVCPAPVTSSDDVIAIWLGAGQWWNAGLDNDLDLQLACERAPMDGTTTVELVDGTDDWQSTWGPADSVVGFTIHTFEAQDPPNLIDADIVLNAATFSFDARGESSEAFDLVGVTAHEMGHVLGLGHPCGDNGGAISSCFNLPPEQEDVILEALMFPSSAVGPRDDRPQSDDLAGITALFGAPRPPPSDLDICLNDDDLATFSDASNLPTDSTWALGDGRQILSPVSLGTPLASLPARNFWRLWLPDGRTLIGVTDGLMPCGAMEELESMDAIEPPTNDDESGDCACAMRDEPDSWPLPVVAFLVLLLARRRS